MFSAAFIELNWKNMVTLNADWDNLIWQSFFSNCTGSIHKQFMQDWLSDLGIQFGINVAINIKDITNINVTWRLESLHQGDQQYCQCQKSKQIIK